MIEWLKRAVRPLRLVAGRFVLVPPYNVLSDGIDRTGLFHRAGLLIADCKTEGDFFEFGVFEGRSLVSAYREIESAFSILSFPDPLRDPRDCADRRGLWARMRFFAFDSFQGLPELTGPDTASTVFGGGKLSARQDQVVQAAREAGISAERLAIVPGWFADTCTANTVEALKLTKASIVHIDCDLYESTQQALELVTHLLTDGTILIFDDWFHFRGNPRFGEQRAFREWADGLDAWAFAPYQTHGAWANSFIASPT